MKVAVDFKAWASKTVTIEISQDKLQALAEELEKPIDELTIDDISDLAMDIAHEEDTFNLCIHCSGYGIGSNHSVDIGDWEVDDNTDREPKYRGIRLVK